MGGCGEALSCWCGALADDVLCSSPFTPWMLHAAQSLVSMARSYSL